MLTPEDKRYIDEAVAAQLDIMSAFRGLPEAAREEIANDIGPYLYSRIQSREKPKNVYTPRWTKGMADINEDDDGVEQGHAGPTMPRWIDIIGGTAYLDSSDPQILHFTAGGGTDCWFDAIVSSCWAVEVAAGRGTEGQTMTSLTGCTFKVYSTVQGVMTGRPADSLTKWNILICSGTYDEDVVISDANKVMPNIQGAGMLHGTYIKSITVTSVENSDDRRNGTWSDFCITGNNTLVFSAASGEFYRMNVQRVNFGNDLSGPVIGSGGTVTLTGSLYVTFTDCVFDNTLTNPISVVSSQYMTFRNCDFYADGIAFTSTCNYLNMTANRFRQMRISIADAIGFRIDDNHFETAAGNTNDSFIKFTSGNQHNGVIGGNYFHGDDFPSLAFIYIDNVSSSTSQQGVSIVNNHFSSTDYAASSYILYCDDTDGARKWVFSNNTIAADSTSGDTPESLGGFTVGGYFSNSVFGPNADAVVARYSITGTDNMFIPSSSMSGTGSTVLGSTELMLAASTVTIASGAITVTTRPEGIAHYTVNGEGAAADVLTTINGGTEAEWILLTAGDADITIDAADNIYLFGGDFDANTNYSTLFQNQSMLLYYRSGPGVWFGFFLSTGQLIEFSTALGTGGVRARAGVVSLEGILDFALPYDGNIASDKITGLNQSNLRITAEGGSGADNLLSIEPASDQPNVAILFIGVSAGSTITLKHANAGGTAGYRILMSREQDLVLNENGRAIFLYDQSYNTSEGAWREVLNNVTSSKTITAQITGTSASTIVPRDGGTIGPMAQGGVILSCVAKKGGTVATTAIGATAWIGDVHLSTAANQNTGSTGTTIFSTKPTITTGNFAATNAVLSTTTFAAGDWFHFFTDQAGTTAGPITVTLQVLYNTN